ncbi:MAG: hypothetical protein ACC608_12955 [Anaerofustis sp.]
MYCNLSFSLCQIIKKSTLFGALRTNYGTADVLRCLTKVRIYWSPYSAAVPDNI